MLNKLSKSPPTSTKTLSKVLQHLRNHLQQMCDDVTSEQRLKELQPAAGEVYLMKL